MTRLLRVALFFCGAGVGCWATFLLLLIVPGPDPVMALLVFSVAHTVVALAVGVPALVVSRRRRRSVLAGSVLGG